MTAKRTAQIAINNMQHYLLRGPVQLRSGSQAGGVAGSFATDGNALYVYGEITGYYLHWLASLADNITERQAAAEAAQQWLNQYLALSPWPPTRLYLNEAPVDWRNDALFAFDLAMIAGGLARCAEQQLIALDQALVKRLDTLLQAFSQSPELGVVINRANTQALPSRWSTIGGPFTAKTASRLLLLNAQQPLHSTLVHLCNKQLAHYASIAHAFPAEMFHPTLYALEGVLLEPTADWEKTATGLQTLLQWQAADGSLPESLDNTALRRNDVAAQALRLAILLEHQLGDYARFNSSIQLLANWLCLQIRGDGTLAFAAAQAPQANTWCGMFAEQALRLYVAREQLQVLPFTTADLV